MILYSGHMFHSSFISREAMVRIQDATEACFQKAVKVPGSYDHRLGISLGRRNGWAFVKKIKRGAVQTWNLANPEHSIRVGHYVLEVNGQHGEVGQLWKSLLASTDICMLVSSRSPDDAASSTGRLTLQHFVPNPVLTESARRYQGIDGIDAIVRRLQAGESVEVEDNIFDILTDLAAADFIPTHVLQNVQRSNKLEQSEMISKSEL